MLAQDRPAVEAFNRTATERTRVETSLLPEPWVGCTDAPILLLLLNPGMSDDDLALHRRPAFRRRIFACHRRELAPFPNYYLDPDVTGPGARWTARILRPLVAEFGAQAVANAVGALEFFPYHSRSFAHHRLRVPSQEFTFSLLRSAIGRGAVVFVTRGRGLWEAAVPELRGYERTFRTNSVQNVVISPRNCPEGWEAARNAARMTPPRHPGLGIGAACQRACETSHSWKESAFDMS